jgi:hypothetical protein
LSVVLEVKLDAMFFLEDAGELNNPCEVGNRVEVDQLLSCEPKIVPGNISVLELSQRRHAIFVDVDDQLHLFAPYWLIKAKVLAGVRLDHVRLHYMAEGRLAKVDFHVVALVDNSVHRVSGVFFIEDDKDGAIYLFLGDSDRLSLESPL